MKIISWYTNHRLDGAGQVAFLASRKPDLVALQEVTPSTRGVLVAELAAHGLGFVRTTVSRDSPRSGPRSYGVLIASRFPISTGARFAVKLPWPEKALSVRVRTPGRIVDVHSVHVPPGSSHEWRKVDVLEAVYVGLAKKSRQARILCGDFNCPWIELPSGEVLTWAQRIGRSGQVYLREQVRGGSGARWDAAERNVVTGLSKFGFQDAYRTLHGYKREGASWVVKRKGRCVAKRRFDHVFVSEIQALSCEYLTDARLSGLSDHTPIEAGTVQPRRYRQLNRGEL